MIFSSPRFFVFLVILLLTLWPRWSLAAKLRILLVASCFFYAAWDVRYLGLLLFVSLVNWWCGERISETDEPRARQRWLVASIIASLGTLGWFKYTNFFLDTLRPALAAAGLDVPHLEILLPAGVSFYTFKTMSYTIDVHRRELAPCRSFLDYATFVTFFPELIAGPIVRASIFLPQMNREIGPTVDRLRTGASLFLLGLVKKLVIADRMAGIADPVFSDPGQWSTATVWCGVVAYALQIYCDFSGYSDMAIGTAKMVGYDLPANFRMPYLARDVADFWRRWHITLSQWLRDYLYIPLGGNRHGTASTYRNLVVTMLFGGLWHGASWNFVLWGGLHGVALAVHRALRSWNRDRPLLPAALATPITTLFVILCWVPFRAPDFDTTMTVFARLFVPSEGVIWLPTWLIRSLVIVGLAHVIGVALENAAERGIGRARMDSVLGRFGARLRHDAVSGWWVELDPSRVGGAFALVATALLVFLFAATGANPFIYFQF